MGPLAYLTDAKAIPDGVRARLEGLDVLVLNALLPRPHPLHLSIPQAVEAAERIGARRTFLTHLTHAAPHAELAAQLPAGIAPAYDGLVIEVGPVYIRRQEDRSMANPSDAALLRFDRPAARQRAALHQLLRQA